MRKLLLSLLVFSSLLASGCGSSDNEIVVVNNNNNGPTWTPPDPANLSANLQRIVDTALVENNTPGALVGVFTPNGSWTSATGAGDLDPTVPISFNDTFPWRSVTKSLTVTVVLQLVAEGQLNLDAPVGNYVSGVPNGGVITLRQLAAMRSGLFNYTSDPAFQQKFGSDFTAVWTDQEILDASFSHPVNFAAGTEYEYSNTNTVLLGVVAETVTGRPLAQLIRERIFQPLGMTGALYMTGTDLPSPFVHGFFFDDDGSFVELISNATALSGSGAVAGKFQDLKTWGTALVAGTLLPADLQRQRFISTPRTNGPIYDTYGLGMGEIRGWWGHTGNGLGYELCVFTEPTTGSQIIVMVNATNENADVPADVADDIMDALNWPR